MTGQTLNGTVNTIPVNGQTNQLTSAVYDLNGNMTTGAGATALTYDVGNRLTSAAEVSGGIEYYGYAPDGKQVYRLLANGSEEFTLYGVQGEKLGVYAPSFNQSTGAAIFVPLRANVYFGGRVIWSDGAPAYQDRLGTNRAQGARFLPYGDEITSTTNDREKFATYTQDSYTGLDYAQQRFYVSTYGRFNSADPYQTSAGPNDPSSWNRYTYVDGDPVNRVDPKGTNWCDGEPTEGTALVGCDSVCGGGEMLDPVSGEGCVPLGVAVITVSPPSDRRTPWEWARAAVPSFSVAALLWMACLAIPGAAEAADVDAQLAEAARSPEAIQRFVETHAAFDWAPLWKALAISPSIFRPCEADWAWQLCSAELIGVAEPAQTIVLLERADSESELYLRYFRNFGPGNPMGWRFAGYFESFGKYFPLRHRVVMFAGAPFLAVTGQGTAGTGVSSEVESWMDLRRTDFSPVFSYTTDARYTAVTDGSVSRHLLGAVTALKKDGPVESIVVSYRMDFTYDRHDFESLPLGSREDTAVFIRQNDGPFQVDGKLSTLAPAELNRLYGSKGDAFSCDDLIRYDFASLSSIASEPDSNDKRRGWLGEFINSWCTDTSEKRRLNALMQPGPARGGALNQPN